MTIQKAEYFTVFFRADFLEKFKTAFQIERQSFVNQTYFSFRSKISPMRFGFALPLLSFITWPLRKFSKGKATPNLIGGILERKLK